MTGLIDVTTTQPPTPTTPVRSWTPGPARPRLSEGALHVWRADLTAVGDELGQLLCREERSRAERFVLEGDRQLWVRARGVLRALLARYLGRDPRTLRFATGAHGKPALLEESTLSFNLTHSGKLAAYAFGAGCAVGVDIEARSRRLDEVALARRAFGPAAAKRLGALEPSARRREFLRGWTRYEAELKCLGRGIAEGGGTERRRPWVAQLALGPAVAGAVAAESAPRKLRCWECTNYEEEMS